MHRAGLLFSQASAVSCDFEYFYSITSSGVLLVGAMMSAQDSIVHEVPFTAVLQHSVSSLFLLIHIEHDLPCRNGSHLPAHRNIFFQKNCFLNKTRTPTHRNVFLKQTFLQENAPAARKRRFDLQPLDNSGSQKREQRRLRQRSPAPPEHHLPRSLPLGYGNPHDSSLHCTTSWTRC